jgi:hypothetical protein
MKTLFKLIFLMALTAISTCAIAQTGKASISDSGLITIPTEAALTDAFAIDISTFGFETPTEVLNFLNASEIQDVAFRPLLDQGLVMVYLQTKKNPDWTINQWNAYLKSKHQANKATINTTKN